MQRKDILKNKKYFFYGIFIGIADLIPGISGGSLAFIFGFYEKLLKNISLFFSLNIKKIDFYFLLFLFLGITFSLFAFSKVISFFLNNPSLNGYLYTFFLGVIFASIFIFIKKIKRRKFLDFLFFVIGIILAHFLFSISEKFQIGLYSPSFFLILVGFFASLAMLLPGISGSMIFVVCNIYPKIINALTFNNFLESIYILSNLFLGIFFGLIFFSKIILSILDKYYCKTILFLLGIMVYSTKPIFLNFRKNLFSVNMFYLLSTLFLGMLFIFFLQKKEIKTKKEKESSCI